MNESWHPVRGYVGLYEVSTLGSVRSLPEINTYSDGRLREYSGKVLVPQISKHSGYVSVRLFDGYRYKNEYIHRIVAKTFLGNKSLTKEVNHKDGNKTNNKLDNLEWVTHSYNNRHAFMFLGRKSKTKPVVRLNDGKRYSSVTAAAKDNNAFKYQIINVCKGRIPSFRQIRFLYVSEVR